MKNSKLSDLILLTLFGFVGSILVGFLLYNAQIFIPTKSVFQFVIYGIYGSLFFSLLKYRSKRDQLFGIIIMFLLNLILIVGNSISIALVLRDILYMGSLFIAIKMYFLFIQRNIKIQFYLRSFALALIYSLSTIILGTLVFIINAKLEFPPLSFLLAIGKTALLIGFGIGLGLDLYLQNKNHIIKFLNIKTA